LFVESTTVDLVSLIARSISHKITDLEGT